MPYDRWLLNVSVSERITLMTTQPDSLYVLSCDSLPSMSCMCNFRPTASFHMRSTDRDLPQRLLD